MEEDIIDERDIFITNFKKTYKDADLSAEFLCTGNVMKAEKAVSGYEKFLQ